MDEQHDKVLRQVTRTERVCKDPRIFGSMPPLLWFTSGKIAAAAATSVRIEVAEIWGLRLAKSTRQGRHNRRNVGVVCEFELLGRM